MLQNLIDMCFILLNNNPGSWTLPIFFNTQGAPKQSRVLHVTFMGNFDYMEAHVQ